MSGIQSVLLPTNIVEDDDDDSAVLPESVSIIRMEDLLAQMRFREVPKRALFSVPFELAENFVIGVKGCVSVDLSGVKLIHDWIGTD